MTTPVPNNRAPPPPNLPGMPQTRSAPQGPQQQSSRSRPVEQHPSSARGRNPGGSPPPNQRRGGGGSGGGSEPPQHRQGRGPQQNQPGMQRSSSLQMKNRHAHPNSNHQAPVARSASQRDVVEDFEDAAKSALALAAVAQAASASNKSPAEAAEIAKAQANSLAKAKQQTPRPIVRPSRVEPRKIQPVELEAVKGLLRASMGAEIVEESKLTASALLQQLANGENDALLQQLLLFEYLRPTGEPTPEGEADLAASSSNIDDFQKENMKVAYACERLKLLLNKVELAYDSVAAMLPEVPPSQAAGGSEYDYGFDDVEPAMVVPDLLPLCTSNPGDATLEFFRSCMGEDIEDSTADSPSLADDKTETDLSTEASALSLGGVDETAKKLDSPSKTDSTHTEKGHHSSMFSHMFSMKKPTINRKTLTSVFSKKRKGKPATEDVDTAEENGDCQAGEYTVQIEREMLGLTVENVLERTVVRTVLQGGPAKKAGAKVGSLIVKVGNIETRNLTHFETIDELRQSQRPLQLVLRQISDDALRSAREEMGRLIRGAGFGKIFDGEPIPEPVRIEPTAGAAGGEAPVSQRPLVGGDRNIDIFSGILRKRWLEAANLAPRNKKDEPILRAGEKLIWILSLFVVGLEREALKLQNRAKENGEGALEQGSSHHGYSYYHHSAKDYADAAKSVSKVLVDFVKKRMDPAIPSHPPEGGNAMDLMGGRGGRGSPMARGGRGRGRGRGPIPGMPDPSVAEADAFNGDKLLTQIGDVLQRTRTFLADPTSAPAALFRGEVIGLLCDILDADTEMKLSEEESVSQTAGGRASPLTDLGSAGSLLKLIVLNCSIMRSPGCEEISSEEKHMDPNELKRRFGEKKEISPKDFHRLHAGNRFLAVVHRLAASRSTSARITACSLGPVLWGHLDFPHQLQLRGVITRALHDVDVIVRKSTATVLHEIAELVFDPRCVPWLVLMCERAMTDPEPLLRSAAMTLTWHLAEHLPNAFLGDASKGSRYLRRLPSRDDPIFADVYLLQCKLLPVATRLAEDRAPQVRLAVAAQCDRLCDALGDHWSSVIIDVLVALLTDSDDRVRGEAVLCVPRLADIVLLSSPPGVIPAGESSVLDALLPAAAKLQKDASSSVRVALATAAGELLTLLVALQRSAPPPATDAEGKPVGPVSIRHQKRHVDERLIPLVQKLLHDPDPEVTSSALRAVTNASRSAARDVRARFNTEDDDAKSTTSHQSHTESHTSMEKKEPVFLPVLSEDQVLRLLPTLSELANSRQWRVRQSAVEIVPALLGCTTQFETRAEIARLCVRLCRDKVDAVRQTAAECLCLGGGSLGSHGEDVSSDWITALVIPQIQTCAKHSDYKQRLLCLKMVESILLNDVCPPKWSDDGANVEGRNITPLRELVKVTLSLANDRIPNVRLNVGKVLGNVIHVFDEEECRVVKYALLQQLKAEKGKETRQDRDVIYFGKKCIQKVRARMDAEADAHAESNEERRHAV